MKKIVPQKHNYRRIFLGILAAVVVLGIVLIAVHESKPAPQASLPIPVVTTPAPAVATQASIETDGPVQNYIEIEQACTWNFVGSCVNVRSGPGTQYPVVMRLRNGMVLGVEADTTPGGGHDWYKVVFENDVRYPERITSDWYVAADPDSVLPFTSISDVELNAGAKVVTDKKIVVDLSNETLTAYEGDTIFMDESVSTGIDTNPTAPGTYEIYKKVPSRYMQGPLPGETTEYYDLPAVPWDMYFTQDGAVLHGAYWHNSFGTPASHGCVNQPPANAKKLYAWAGVGTPVIVQN